VVLILASSTVFVKASSLVNRDLAGIVRAAPEGQKLALVFGLNDDFNLQIPQVPQSLFHLPSCLKLERRRHRDN
jgi:hypothetical protein